MCHRNFVASSFGEGHHEVYIYIMKKLLIRSVFALITLMLLCLGAAYFWLKSSLPVYSGEKKLAGLLEPVDAYFDEYGIPHIDAKNAEDAYRALGYLHAQ